MLESHLTTLLAGLELPGLKPGHLREASRLVEGYLSPWTDPGAVLLLTLDLGMLFWLDDRADRALELGVTLDWQPLFDLLESGAAPRSQEAEAVAAVKKALLEREGLRRHTRLWEVTLARTFRAWEQEQKLGGELTVTTLDAYLEIGALSSAIPHLVVTAGLLLGLPVVERLAQPAFTAQLFNLAAVARLENDLFGLERERKEGGMANAVLILEQRLGAEEARAAVEVRLELLRARLGELLSGLSIEDPIRRLMESMLRTHQTWYTEQAERYREG